jgi:serine/threonine-protein kinase
VERNDSGWTRLSALLARLADAPPRELPGAWGAALKPGERVGRFEILREIGRGGFGIVYEALDPELGRTVAVKVLRPARRPLEDAEREVLRREAEAVASLDHPGIVTLHDAGTCESGPYLVLELLHGESLETRIARGALAPREALRVAREVAGALAHAHGRGVLHLDLKPANVFITEDGRVKLLDFGLAHLLGSSGSRRGGTPAYMAPEQARGEPLDARADVFAFGVALSEALGGRKPYEVREGRSAVLDGAAPAPLPAALPGPISLLIERCLSPDPGRRPRSGEALLEELLAFEQGAEPMPTRAGEAVPAAPGVSAPSPPALAMARARLGPRRWAAAAVLVAVLVAAWLLFLGRGKAIDTLAVLPLSNATGDSSVEYLVDGITESLINSLSQLPGLRVMARSTVFSLRDRAAEPREVGRRLKVRAVLTGQVRQQGDVLTIGAELVDVADGSQLWGERTTWRLPEIGAMQVEVATRIAEKLRPRLTGAQQQRLAKRHTENSEAYLLYLRGRSFALGTWTADGFRKGIDYLNRATRADPTYALAYAGLAATYYDASGVYLPPDEAMQKARVAASKALALDEELAEAHAALAQVAAQYEWNWTEADTHYRRALELNPSLAPAHLYYGFYLAHRGQLEAGLLEMREAQRLDPLTTLTSTSVAHYLYVTRRIDEAISLCRKTIEADPSFFLTHSILGLAYEQQGRFEEAIAEFSEAKRLDAEQSFTLGYLGHAYAMLGRRQEARAMIEGLERRAATGYVDPFSVAIVHVGLGETDQAFAWLEKAFRARSESLLFYKDAPILDGLQSDPRFVGLLGRMGLAPRRDR